MPDLIEYELQLPATLTGEKLAKTIGRILKHTYQAKRLRVQHSKDTLVITARVDRFHLNAIRGAVKMTMMARGITDENGHVPEVKNLASHEQSATESDGRRGA